MPDTQIARLVEALSESFLQACVQAGTNFVSASEWLRFRLPEQPEPETFGFIKQRLLLGDFGSVACTIYLLSPAHSPDLAAAAGWHALELGCDDDQVIIALADVMQMQDCPRQSPSAMMRERVNDRRSIAFFTKLADFYWVSGRAFLTEDLLRGLICRGRQDLMLRLAEHWFQQRDWASAHDLLHKLPPDQVTVYTIYLTTRCAAALLLETEVVRGLNLLAAAPEPGPRYAKLLQAVWTWRVGEPIEAVKACPDGSFPPLVERDATALRSMTILPASTSEAPSTLWRMTGSRHDLPNVLGIGMQRTGTSWLWNQLRRHPDVQNLSFKEPVFFNDVFGSLENVGHEIRDKEIGEAGVRYWQGPIRSLMHYRRLYQDGKRVRIDMSPAYGELPKKVVARVQEILGPNTKILLSVRDPVERSWSNLKYDLQTTGEHPLNLSFQQRMALYRSVATLRRCDYPATLKIWRRYFTEIKVVFTDDIAVRPAEVLADIGDFIGLPAWSPSEYTVPYNISAEVDLPHQDRLFLFGLHQPLYDALEAELGGPALLWRQRQLALLNMAG